jgi:hypothetical protein
VDIKERKGHTVTRNGHMSRNSPSESIQQYLVWFTVATLHSHSPLSTLLWVGTEDTFKSHKSTSEV